MLLTFHSISDDRHVNAGTASGALFKVGYVVIGKKT
jgi:hypothetical protein